MARIAVDGDSCGGIIIATARSTINGDGLARIGDFITTHGPSNAQHVGARIVSGSFRLRVGGRRLSRSGDYATCGHVISASNATDDTSRHWAPQPPQATNGFLSEGEGSLYVEGTIPEEYPDHCGALFRWKGPGEEFDSSREVALPWPGIFIPMDEDNPEDRYVYAHVIGGLTPLVTYDVEMIATRVYAENAVPIEFTGTPREPLPDPPDPPDR